MTLFELPDPVDFSQPGRYVELVIRGIPVQQGSMKAVPTKGKRFAQVLPDNEDKLLPWRAHIAAVGRRYTVEGQKIRRPLGEPLGRGPALALFVETWFTFTRPKTVTRTLPTVWPDLDKLERAIYDGLGQGDGSKARLGRVVADDAAIVDNASHKRYAGHPRPTDPPNSVLDSPGVVIRIWEDPEE